MKLYRKSLTPEQYRRANKLTASSISLVYIIFLILNFTSNDIGKLTNKFIFAGIYLAWYVLTAVIVMRHVTEKKAMLMLAIGFELSYTLLVFTGSSVCMLLIFPVLITIIVYFNEVLFLWGAGASQVIMLIKSTIIRFDGTGTEFDFKVINVAILGTIICVFGGLQAIRLLIKFSKEENDAVQELLEKQQTVAREVNSVAESVSSEFVGVLENLENINTNVSYTVDAMDSIAKGSEETASAATNQSMMTNEIQRRLESTSDVAGKARTTTNDLKLAIENGKNQSEELERQSKIVDEYTNNISNTIDELVRSVSKVYEITDSILNISSQTNLLALNASIEAARAGEAGRGFAVVADQIRTLAEETKTSTEKITGIMNDLSSVTNKAQEAVKGSVESITLQRKQIELVNDSFQIVDNGIGGLSDDVNTMNNEVVAVLDANNNIVDSVETLAAISEEMSSNAIQSASDVAELAKQMERFTEVINQTSDKLSELKSTAAID